MMKFKINVITVLNILIIAPLIKPTGLVYLNPNMNTLFQNWKALSIIVMLFIVLIHFRKLTSVLKKNRYIKKGIVGLIIFEAIYLINTILRGVEYSDLLNNCFTCTVLFVYILIESNLRKKSSFCSGLDFVCTFYITCQIVSMVTERLRILPQLSGNGTPIYFFGPDNYSAFIVIPLLGILMYLGCKQEGKIRFRKRDVSLLLVLTACYIWTGSVTAALSLIVFVVATIFFSNSKRLIEAFSVRGVLIILCITLLLIISANIQNYFLGVLSFVGKAENGFTLNSRTIIWAQVLKIIYQNPFLGIGDLSEYEMTNYILGGASHAHNIFLELLMRTGIIGTISYLYFMLSPLIKKRATFVRPKNSVLWVAMYVYLVLSFMDFYPLIQAPILLIAFIYMSAEDQEYHEN